jgi:hypothetical protein
MKEISGTRFLTTELVAVANSEAFRRKHGG